MSKPLNESLIEIVAQYLRENVDRGLPEDVQDIYDDAADALLDLLAYWRGYEEDDNGNG